MIEFENTEWNLGTSISGWARAVMLALQSFGIDSQGIFRECGLNPADQANAMARNDVSRVQHVWRRAESCVSNKSLLAEEIVKFLHPASIPGLGFGLYVSETICDLLERFARYRSILSSSVDIFVTKTPRTVGFRIHDQREVRSHMTTVVALLYVLRICRELAGPSLAPKEVQVPWTHQEYAPALKAYGLETFIKSDRDHMLVFDRAEVEQRLPSANAALASYLDRFCEDYISALADSHLILRVRARIAQMLPTGNTSVSTVAASFHMSARTLQRKLLRQGTSYREVLAETRKKMAREYAANTGLRATQIAFLLGFSGLAQFTAAHRSWFGASFGDYRNALFPSKLNG